MANANNHKSIAFPALGTGYHKIPADVAAESIVAAIAKFSDQQKQQNLKDIRVVLYGGSKDLSTLEKVGFVFIAMYAHKYVRVSINQLKLHCQVKSIILMIIYTDKIVI